MATIPLILTLTPFFVVFLLKKQSTLSSFAYILGIVTSIHIFIGLITQAFGFFNYEIVFSLHAILLLSYAFLLYKDKFLYIKKDSNNEEEGKISRWKDLAVILAVVVISGIPLWSMHYNYTGIADNYNEEVQLVDSSYKYPTFSDEWVAVGVANIVKEENRLPVSDVFYGKPKVNFLFIFHSLVAELSLLYEIDLLTGYHILALVFSLMTIVVSYLVIRSANISILAACIAVLFIPYINSGSNLPGLWYLLPWNVGFIFFLLVILSMIERRHILTCMFSILSFFIYPPILILLLPLLIAYVIKERSIIKKISFIYILFSAIVILGVFILQVPVIDMLSRGVSHIVRSLNSFYGNPPRMLFWQIVPILTIPFLFIGIYRSFTARKYYFVVPWVVSIVLWCLYALGTPTFFIDYHRTVVLGALLSILIVGQGIGVVVEKIDNGKLKPIHNYIIIISIMLLFILNGLNYTSRDNWKDIYTIVQVQEGNTFIHYKIPPPPPVNRYLHPDDIDLFSNYSDKYFIAPEWKSLVIAVSTDNIPAQTKPATFTITEINYQIFMNSSCEEKLEIIKEKEVDLVYASNIECEGFVEKGKSEEGLILYEF